MAWEITDNYFADQDPQGLGRREAPPTGAYRVKIEGSEYRLPRSGKGDKRVYLNPVILDEGDAEGMTLLGVNIAPPKETDAERLRNVRDAVQKAAIVCFNPSMASAVARLRNVRNRLHSGLFDNKVGHMWYERGDEDSYPTYRFLTQEQYDLITSGKFKPALKNTADNGGGLGATGAAGSTGPTLGTPPTLPTNGAGAPHMPTPPDIGNAGGGDVDLLG